MGQQALLQENQSRALSQKDVCLSVIIPAYNEEALISRCIIETQHVLADLHRPCEIIVVDDGSSDLTCAIAEQMVSSGEGLSVVSYVPNAGKGYAIARGVQKSHAEFCVWMDADLSIHPRNIIQSLDILMASGCEIVIASKHHPASQIAYPFNRRFLSLSFNLLVRILFRNRISDTQCGFKVFRRTAADSILPFIRGKRFAFDAEFIVRAERAGWRIKEVPITLHHRPDSRVSVREIFLMAKDLVELRIDLFLRPQPRFSGPPP